MFAGCPPVDFVTFCVSFKDFTPVVVEKGTPVKFFEYGFYISCQYIYIYMSAGLTEIGEGGIHP